MWISRQRLFLFREKFKPFYERITSSIGRATPKWCRLRVRVPCCPFYIFAKFTRCIMRIEWIDAGGNPAVRHEGVAARDNVIKHATHRATVLVGPTLKSSYSLLFLASPK